MKRWQSLDLLRGFAVIFMLVNHSLVQWLNKSDFNYEYIISISFISSFAPVLFFFATGVGFGLAHEQGRPAAIRPLLIKVIILIVADIFMRSGDLHSFGWDFLAFIAFSMLFLHFFRGRNNAIIKAFISILILFIIRYGVGGYYGGHYSNNDWIAVIIGIKAIDGVSYWFTPWLIYPLIGFIYGAIYKFHNEKHKRLLLPLISLMLISGLIISSISFVMSNHGSIYFRWGTVSVNFFIASIACLLFCVALANIISELFAMRFISTSLSMQGVSSLAIVPVHYLFLNITNILDVKMSAEIYLFSLAPWLVVCFYIAKRTDSFAKYLALKQKNTYLFFFCLCILIFAILCSTYPEFKGVFLLTFLAQYLLCLMLAFSYSRKYSNNTR